VQNNWIEAAKDLVGYLYSPQTEWTNGYLQDLLPLRDDLVDFVEKGTSEQASNTDHNGLASEWVVELSLVKMVVEMHDSKHTHSGLRPRRAGLKVLWTRETDFLNPLSRDHLFHVAFKSIADLRDKSSEIADKAYEAQKKQEQAQKVDVQNDGRSSPKSVDSNTLDNGYDLLFGDLALDISTSSSSDKSEKINESRQLLARDKEEEKEPMISQPVISKKPSYATDAAPISLLDFDDDDLALDDVLKLRILLDEQEAKLEFLREKVEGIEEAETELNEQEEKIGDMLDEVNNQKDTLLGASSKRGLSKARRLLLRICELEERVLCREVEVGQLKNDISFFELEANEDLLDILLIDEI
jgi:hypothetical protein